MMKSGFCGDLCFLPVLTTPLCEDGLDFSLDRDKLNRSKHRMRLEHSPAVDNKEGVVVWLYQARRKKGLSPKFQRPC